MILNILIFLIFSGFLALIVLGWKPNVQEVVTKEFKSKQDKNTEVKNSILEVDQFYFSRKAMEKANKLYIYNKYKDPIAYIEIEDYEKHPVFGSQNVFVYDNDKKEAEIIKLEHIKKKWLGNIQVFSLCSFDSELRQSNQIGYLKYNVYRRKCYFYYNLKAGKRMTAEVKSKAFIKGVSRSAKWTTHVKNFVIKKNEEIAELKKVNMKQNNKKMYYCNIFSATEEDRKKIIGFALLLNLRFKI